MAAHDWTELQTLGSNIETARSRLAQAKRLRDFGRVRQLEQEIAEAEARRDHLVDRISSGLAGAGEPAPQPEAAIEPLPSKSAHTAELPSDAADVSADARPRDTASPAVADQSATPAAFGSKADPLKETSTCGTS